MTDISLSAIVKNYGDIYLSTQDTEHSVEFFEELEILPRIWSDTWITNSKLSLAQIAKIMFCWSHKLPKKFAVAESSASAQMIVDWYNFCYD
ncbi:18307_t:CDS:2, partial [Gigaspora margarita]